MTTYKISSILIVKPSSLGDIVHTLPAAALLRDTYPEAEITWVINPEWAPLLRGNRCVDHVHIFPRGDLGGFGMSKHLLPWLREVGRLRPDIAFDFQGLLRSALIGKMSHPREFYGMSDAREGARFFYRQTAPVDRAAHAVERYLSLVESFGVPIERPLRFPLPTGDRIERFDEDEPFFLLHPFARGQKKSLSDLAVEEFCHALAPERVVLVGRTKRDLPVPDNCVNLLNHTTILQLGLAAPPRSLHHQRRQRPNAHRGRSLRPARLHPHLERSAKSRALQPRRLGLENGDLLRVHDLPAPSKEEKGRAFRPKDVNALLPLIRSHRP